jgi:hypothetical protein
MNFMERRKALAELPERDKAIYKLVWKCRNHLVNAANNAGRNAELTEGKAAEDALRELEDLLLGLTTAPA